uniref:Uncharacterized protein n=1 Tax=Cucumis melo TaxID=3656 RepID=A0A9I9DVW9_CUCME
MEQNQRRIVPPLSGETTTFSREKFVGKQRKREGELGFRLSGNGGRRRKRRKETG